jgi:signal transduction histidine kinase
MPRRPAEVDGARARRPTSLRWRLTAWVAAILLASAAVTYVVVYRDTGRELRGQIERDIRGDSAQLEQSLRLASPQTPAAAAETARRYMQGQPYDSTATLLVAIVPGQGAISNHPELVGSSGVDDGESAQTQAGEDRLGAHLMVPRPGMFTLSLPDVGKVRLYERSVVVGRVPVRVIVGEPLAIVDRAQDSVAKALLIAGILVLVLALVASYVAGARFAGPLRRMAAVAARVDAGDLEPRMHSSSGRPDEIRVLADSFNHMLDRLSEAFAAQRAFVADASHELRTPLTVIRGQLEVLAAAEDVSQEDVQHVERIVRAEVARIGRIVDDLLLLAQSERTDFLVAEPIDLRSFVSELWEGSVATADRRFERGEVAPAVLLADPDRLAQALRNLIRNAIAHTAPGVGEVSMTVEPAGLGRVRFVVEDDGAGIPASDRERVFERFYRTDVARSRAAGGAGLGLAIVRAIATAHGGSVVARERPGGGSRFEFELPGYTPVAAGREIARPAPAG